MLDIFKTKDNLTIGDTAGYLYTFDASLSGKLNTANMAAIHITPIFDGGEPDTMKRWPGIVVTSRKPTTTNSGQVLMYYRTSSFDSTQSSSWTRIDSTITLDTTAFATRCFINRTSRAIQFAFADTSGSTFEIKECVILAPQVEENR
jgi:hypothetical protein